MLMLKGHHVASLQPDVKVHRRVLQITVCGPVLHGACSDALVMADSLQLQGL